MGGVLETASFHVVNWFLGGVLNVLGALSAKVMQLAVIATQLPWVRTLQHTVLAVTWALLGLRIAYEALLRYILWSEGTADPDGTVLNKHILRTAIFIALSGGLATAVFGFGLELGNVVIATPMDQGSQVFHNLVATIATVPSALMAAALVTVLGVLVAVVLFVVNLFQMAVRGAELVIYVLAGPLVALGHMGGSDGGTWGRWWQGLVGLSLAQVVQLVALKGMLGSTQAIGLLSSRAAVPLSTWFGPVALTGAPFAGAAAGVPAALGAVAGVLLAVLWMVGWLIVAIRGPALLREWMHHSGAGGAIIGASTTLSRNALQNIRIFGGK